MPATLLPSSSLASASVRVRWYFKPCFAAKSRLLHGAHVGHETVPQVGRALVEVGAVVFEDDDGRGVGERLVAQHLGGHAGVVLVDEAQVGPDEVLVEAVALDDLLEERTRARAGWR
jgi:hypothetical protein